MVKVAEGAIFAVTAVFRTDGVGRGEVGENLYDNLVRKMY